MLSIKPNQRRKTVLTVLTVCLILILAFIFIKITPHIDYFNSQKENKQQNLKTEFEVLQQLDKNNKLTFISDSTMFITARRIYIDARETESLNHYQFSRKLFSEIDKKFPNTAYKYSADEYIERINKETAELKAKQQLALCKENIENEIIKEVENLNFSKATKILNDNKSYLTDKEFNHYKEYISNEKDKPIVVDLRDLIAEHDKYEGKKIKVDRLYVISNEVSLGWFNTYRATDNDYFDTDASVYVDYKIIDDNKEWRYFSTSEHKIISVVGTYHRVIYFGRFIKATQIEIIK